MKWKILLKDAPRVLEEFPSIFATSFASRRSSVRLSKRSFSWAPYHEIGFASIVSFFICLSFFSAIFLLRKILLAPRACDRSKEINVNYPRRLARCCRRRRNCKIMRGSVPRMAIYRRAWSRKKLIIYREPSGASSSQNVKWKQLKVMCRDCDYLYSVRDDDMRMINGDLERLKAHKWLERRSNQEWRYMANFNWFMRRSSLPPIFLSISAHRAVIFWWVHNIKADKNIWMEYLALLVSGKEEREERWLITINDDYYTAINILCLAHDIGKTSR